MKTFFLILVVFLFHSNEMSFAQKLYKSDFISRTRSVQNLQVDIGKNTKVTCLGKSKISQLLKIFSAKPGENLEIDIDPGNIKINTWNKNKVSIEVEFKKEYEPDIFEAEKIGNTIKFEMKLNNDWNSNIKVKIKTPSNFNFDLHTTGGYIKIEDNISGKLTAKTDGGNVRFNNVYGEVSVKSLGGNIKGKNVDDNVQLFTNGGNITLENVRSGKTEIETLGGNIKVGSVSSDLTAKTSGGHININDVGGSANVVTYGGHITLVNVSGSVIMKTFGGHLNLKSASGKVVATTMGGHINLKNITGNISASTKGGNIYAELSPATNTTSSLETLAGNIKLRIPKLARANINVFVKNEAIEDDDEIDKIIESDFSSSAFDVNKNRGEINATYILNGGGAKISLKCIDGNVKIRKWEK